MLLLSLPGTIARSTFSSFIHTISPSAMIRLVNSLTSHNYVNIIDQIIPLVFNSDGEPILVLPKLLVASFRWFFLESSTLRLSTSTATSLDSEYALIVMFSQGLCCWLCLTPVNKILRTLKQWLQRLWKASYQPTCLGNCRTRVLEYRRSADLVPLVRLGRWYEPFEPGRCMSRSHCIDL